MESIVDFVFDNFIWMLISLAVVIRLILYVVEKIYSLCKEKNFIFIKSMSLVVYFLICFTIGGFYYALFMHKLYDGIDNNSYVFSIIASVYFVIVSVRFASFIKR